MRGQVIGMLKMAYLSGATTWMERFPGKGSFTVVVFHPRV
jgi:hypothetical protein